MAHKYGARRTIAADGKVFASKREATRYGQLMLPRPGQGGVGGVTVAHKYGARRTIAADGKVFASKREATRYGQLTLMESAGVIRDLVLQPKFTFESQGERLEYPSGRAVTYYADFAYFDVEKNQAVVEDAKGMDTPASKLKRALVKYFHGIDVILV